MNISSTPIIEPQQKIDSSNAPEVAANAKLNNHRLYSPPVSSSTISKRKKFLLPINVIPSLSSPEAKASKEVADFC